jgi:hypothetical protein
MPAVPVAIQAVKPDGEASPEVLLGLEQILARGDDACLAEPAGRMIDILRWLTPVVVHLEEATIGGP